MEYHWNIVAFTIILLETQKFSQKETGVLVERCHLNYRDCYLVDPASNHMLVLKIKPCMSKYKHLYCETANGSLNQL